MVATLLDGDGQPRVTVRKLQHLHVRLGERHAYHSLGDHRVW